MGMPRIIEEHTDCGVDIVGIVKRILRYAPEGCLDGLEQIRILDHSPIGFARYIKEDREIQLFAQELVAWLPWVLKKTYIFPYLTIGMAVGHEIDHHVHRDNDLIDKELSAEKNSLVYVYPSFGVFKPVVKVISWIGKAVENWKQRKANSKDES